MRFRQIHWLYALTCLLLSVASARGQNPLPRRAVPDTLMVQQGFLVILADTSFVAEKDTIIITQKGRIKEDPYAKSDRFYDSLQERADKARVTHELHELLIRKKRAEPRIDSAIVKGEDPFREFEGKIIRSIKIKHVDMLEGSVIDTTLVSTTKVGKVVNRLHADTRDFIIRNNLLFEPGDRVDPWQLSDNERILRQFKTIRDARIYLRTVEGMEDHVDVVVVTQDVASVGASGRYRTPNNFGLSLYDINILGYAKQLQVSYFRNTAGAPMNGYEVALREPNFGNSFITGEVRYTDNYLRNRASLFLGRDFLTPEMKYAGGLEAFTTRENYLTVNDTIPTPYAQNSVDVWLGRSFHLARRTNFVVAARTQESRFIDRPFVASDSNYFFFDRSLYLGSLTLIQSNFFKGSLIRGFGKTEDVPVLAWVSTTAGKEYHEFAERAYVDVRAGIGRYWPRFGYLNITSTVGGFRVHDNWQDGLIQANAMYFSNLMEPGRTKIRQFINLGLVSGYARTIQPFLGVAGRWRGDFNFVPVGNQRLSLGTETVYFTPGYFYGFKFAVYHGLDLNLLRTRSQDNEILFPSIRGGIRMLNDNLTFPTVSVDMIYYARAGQYPGSFNIGVSTTLPSLFGTQQNFKPQIAPFQ